MTSTFLLSCSISAAVRQSIQIKFDDLKLPDAVIETLTKQNTVSLRPNLSNALKAELDDLRVMQRELYDSCCIHFGDTHFVTDRYFQTANDLIAAIRTKAELANEILFNVWESERAIWQATVENFLRPLFKDDMEYTIASDAYMRVFPTQNEYKQPIRVHVVGPLPVDLEIAQAPTDSVQHQMALANSLNTSAVIEAARASAADKALAMSAELLDDLDVRTPQKIGRQQTGGDRKRGSWQVTAQKLQLISDSVPGFDNLANLATALLAAGEKIQSPVRQYKEEGAAEFQQVQDDIRKELETIVNSRDSSKGLEMLRESLVLSSTYKHLCERIKNVESKSALNLLVMEASTEASVYEQRAKQLNKLIAQRRELIDAAGENLDELVSTVATIPVEADF